MSDDSREAGGAVDDAGTKEALFWRLAEDLLRDPAVERGTMMGFPCLRVEGRFFVSIDPRSGDLVVKLPSTRVEELISAGQGRTFAPSGRPFREWVSIPQPSGNGWSALMAEALAFVAKGTPE